MAKEIIPKLIEGMIAQGKLPSVITIIDQTKNMDLNADDLNTLALLVLKTADWSNIKRWLN